MLKSTIKRLIYNHHDDVDGWQLHDGTLVHFPPHIGEQLGQWIGEGDEVALQGECHANRNGDEVLFPTYVESQGWSLTFDQKKPRHRNGLDDQHPPDHDAPPVTNEDIMRELSKIRRMIEAWSKQA